MRYACMVRARELFLANEVGYIMVIARLPGIYGNVNRHYPRAAPSDSGRFTAINPWSRAITITYISHLLESILLYYTSRCITRIFFLSEGYKGKYIFPSFRHAQCH